MDYLRAFDRTVRCTPEKTAIVTERGRRISYRELDDRSTALARALEERIPGKRCAALVLNGHPAIEIMIAGHKRGIGTVQLPFRAGAAELESMLEPTDAGAIVFDDANAELALDLLERTGVETAIHAGTDAVDHEAVESYEPIAEGNAEGAPLPDDGDEHGIFFTSGTTSTPKSVPFDREQMWYGSTQVIMEMGIEETDTALVSTPWYHMVTTDAWILPHLQAGATLVVQADFRPDECLRLVEEHGVTGLLAVPTQLDALVDAQIEGEYDLDRLSYIRTGGAVVTADLVERTGEHLSDALYNTYGLTEGGPNLSFAHPSLQADHAGTIGKESYVWELRVVEAESPGVDPDPDAVVDPGETGEIIGRSPGMGTGYLDNPEADDDVFVGEWLRTGDVADVDEDGYLYVVDRIDNMIVSGGENVYPQEVERALESHPEVEEAIVFGRADDHWGEVVACVVSAPGGVTEDELDRFCRDSDELADFKRPRSYAFTDEALPRTDTGTLQRERAVSKYFDGAS